MQHHISCAIIGTEALSNNCSSSGYLGARAYRGGRMTKLTNCSIMAPSRRRAGLLRCAAAGPPRAHPPPPRLPARPPLGITPLACQVAPARTRGMLRGAASDLPRGAPLCLAGSGGPRGSGRGRRWLGGGRGGASEREQWPRASRMIRTLMKRSDRVGFF